jgi:hypothetical protein
MFAAFLKTWARRDSNPRSSGPEPDALSTEPRALTNVYHNAFCQIRSTSFTKTHDFRSKFDGFRADLGKLVVSIE